MLLLLHFPRIRFAVLFIIELVVIGAQDTGNVVHIFKFLNSFAMYLDRVLGEKLRLSKVASVSIGCLELSIRLKA